MDLGPQDRASAIEASVAAITHVRKDDFFLSMWVDHYSALVGRRNCHVILDGDDWTCNVDLRDVNVSIARGRLGKRILDDKRLADLHSRLVSEILGSGIRYIIRGDCDEFIVLDPASGLTFDEALAEADEHGHLYMRGLDIIQDLDSERDLDLAMPVMSQRKFGLIQKHFFKPSVLCQERDIMPGGHAVPGVVKVSSALTLLHLANADGAAMKARFAARMSDFPNGSYEGHLSYRNSLSDVMHRGVAPMPYDIAMAAAAVEFATRNGKAQVGRPQKFRSGNVEVDAGYGPLRAFFVELPERMAELL